MRIRVSLLVAWAATTFVTAGCGGGTPAAPPRVVIKAPPRELPPPTPAPSCVRGALVTSQRVCGLGIAGRAFYWNDEKMRGLARRRAARNLAGMIRTIVSSAMQIHQTDEDTAIRWERYLEIDEALVDQIEQSADHELWFDVRGEGPFQDPERTYNCACLTAAEAGIRIDTSQATQHAIARQYPVNEVPEWLSNPDLHNDSLHCAVGFHGNMYHPEEMYEPLTESVRVQLMGATRSWILSEFSEQSICGGLAGTDCEIAIDSVVEAANEGVSRGVVLTAVWLDKMGIGPANSQKTAYGWGCVFDRVVLEKARRRIASLQLEQ